MVGQGNFKKDLERQGKVGEFENVVFRNYTYSVQGERMYFLIKYSRHILL